MIAHTDASVQPGSHAGWAFVIVDSDGRIAYCDGGEMRTSSANRAELMAAVKSAEYGATQIRTDSEYVVRGAGKKNRDLWQKLKVFLDSGVECVKIARGENMAHWLAREMSSHE